MQPNENPRVNRYLRDKALDHIDHAHGVGICPECRGNPCAPACPRRNHQWERRAGAASHKETTEMSTHPNAILLLVLKPDDLARKTHRAIMEEAGGKEDSIKIDGDNYHCYVMESDYEEGFQITADKGDIIVFDMVTYGYGERIAWAELERKKQSLEKWSAGVCERHHCKAAFYVTANYW
jgi:hypothetical protein